MRCSLCGFKFDETRLVCHGSCPLNVYCAVVCCPHCGYQTVDMAKSPVNTAVRSLLARFRSVTPSEMPPEDIRLSALQRGQSASVIAIHAADPALVDHLQVYGIVRGAQVTLKQRSPTFVLQIGYTELSIERAVVNEIQVKVINAENLLPSTNIVVNNIDKDISS
jgi:Fe2+ transport system protein FeoA